MNEETKTSIETTDSQTSSSALAAQEPKCEKNYLILSRRTEWICLGALMLWALIIRLYKLNEVPVHVMCDEADNLGEVLKVLAWQGPGFFGFDWKPQPAFSIYVMAAFMKVLGVHIWSLRFPSVFFSVVTLLPFYFLAKRSVSQVAALAAAFMMSSGVWYLHFSRSGWENIHICLYSLMGFLLLVKANERSDWKSFLYYVGSGFFAGLGVIAYFSGKIILPSLLVMYPFYLIVNRREWKRQIIGFTLLTVTALLVSWPHLKIAALPQNKDFANRRIENVYIFSWYNYKPEMGTKTEVLKKQFIKNIAGFFDPELSNQPRYGRVRYSLLDYVTGALFAFGAFVSLFRLRKMWLWWAMFGTHFLLAEIASRGTPDPARGVGMLPAIYFWVAVGIDMFKPCWCGFFQRRFPIFLAAIAIGSAWYNIQGYFEWCRTEDAIKNRHPMIFESEFDFWLDAQQKRLADKKGAFNLEQWEVIRKQLREKMMKDSGRAALPQDGGLFITAYDNIEWKGEPFQKIPKSPPIVPSEIDRPRFSLRLTGLLKIEFDGDYIFRLMSDDGSELFIDGMKVVNNGGHHGGQEASGTTRLLQGQHKLEVRYFQDDGAKNLELTWTPPLGVKETIPLGLLTPEEF